MKILKRYLDDPVFWFKTTLAECIDRTEGAGYWEPGTVEGMLKEGQTVWTPFAEYKVEKTAHED